MPTIESRIAALEARAKTPAEEVVFPDEEAMNAMSDDDLITLYVGTMELMPDGKIADCTEASPTAGASYNAYLETLSDECIDRLSRIIWTAENKVRASHGLPPTPPPESLAAESATVTRKTPSLETAVRAIPPNERCSEMAKLAALPMAQKQQLWTALAEKQAADTATDWACYSTAELIHIYMCENNPEFYGRPPVHAESREATKDRLDGVEVIRVPR